MKKTFCNFRGLFAFVLAVLVIGAGLSFARTVVPRSPRSDPGRHLDEFDPAARRSLIAHDIGNVRTTLSNWGEMGNPDNSPGFRGFEFPINSGNDFLFSAGVWVGAIVNGQPRVSTTTDGDNGTNSFWPEHIGTVPADRVDNDNDDWFVGSKNFSSFGNPPLSYAFGAKGLDDDADFNPAAYPAGDDRDGNGQASSNWDLGGGIVDFDDDNDGLVDEDSVYFVAGLPFNWQSPDGDQTKLDTGPSGDANHDGNCNYDPEGHIDEDPAGDISHDRIDNDNDGLVDGADSDLDGDANPGSLDDDNDGEMDEDGNARGVQEYFCVFTDDIPASYVQNPSSGDPTPLNIEMLQRSYAFPEEYASSFILIDYRIRNTGALPLNNLYLAMFADADIGAVGETGDAASLNDGNYYDSTRLMMIQGDFPFMTGGPTPGIFAMRVVKTPVALDQLRMTFANFERVSGGDPETPQAKYQLMTSARMDPATPQQGDWRFMLAFGAQVGNGFQLNPGNELPITVALIGGHNVLEANRNAEWALAMYLNDFQGPSAPDAPRFALDVYTDRVRIRWEPNAEASVDAITGFHDFEGYTVERSLDGISWATVAAYDVIDRLDTVQVRPDSFYVDPSRREFEWQNYNAGMPRDTLWLDDAHTRFQYVVIDSGLIAGHTYQYIVRAFDKGVVGAGILYSGVQGNTREATISRVDSTGAPTDLSQVFVYPNPYKGSHRGETGERALLFKGLPATRNPGECLIRIYTLAGDAVATVDHVNGTEDETWNMITRYDQEIVSGIYYYTVEYKKPGGGTERIIDKFVVIK